MYVTVCVCVCVCARPEVTSQLTHLHLSSHKLEYNQVRQNDRVKEGRQKGENKRDGEVEIATQSPNGWIKDATTVYIIYVPFIYKAVLKRLPYIQASTYKMGVSPNIYKYFALSDNGKSLLFISAKMRKGG